MEEWQKHIHLSGNHCFEMYFGAHGRTIKFKVKGKDSHGNITVVECATGTRFTFNIHQLLKRDYGTLVEVDCDDCPY